MKYAIHAMTPFASAKGKGFRTSWRQSVYDGKDAAEAKLAATTKNWKDYQVALKTPEDEALIPCSYEG